jgi:hypothetical protein
LSDASADTRSDISRQWIKAHLLGGIPFNAVPAVAVEIIGWAGITPGHVSPIELALLAAGLVAAYSVALAFLGYLNSGVLGQKFPLFPRRAWVVLFGLCGALIGVVSPTVYIVEASDRASVGLDDSLVWLVAAIFGMIAGGIFGALQAFVLRNTADGLRVWILFSALATLPILVMIPGNIYLPASSLARAILDLIAGLVATVIGAVIMLPAVNRLHPRQP